MTERSSSLPIEIDVGIRVWALAFSANGKYLVSGDGEKVRVWRLGDAKAEATMQTGTVYCLAVSNDGKWIAAGTLWDDVFVWDATTHEQVIAPKEDRCIIGVDFSPESSQLVSASSSDTATVWDVANRKQVRVLYHKHLRAAKWSPQGNRIATAAPDSVRVWDGKDGHLLIDIPVRVTPYFNTGLLWFDNHLLVVSNDKIKELDVSTGSTVSEWPVADTSIYSCVAIPKHGQFIAYTTEDAVTFWSTTTHAQLARIQHPPEIHCIAFSPDDRSLAISGDNGRIIIESLSRITYQIPLSRLCPSFQELEFQISDTALDLWKHGQLVDVEALFSESQMPGHRLLACRALVRARLQKVNAALADAEMAVKMQPSVIGYIAKSIAHVSKGERSKAYRSCDVALAHCDPSHIHFLLLIKAIVVFIAGEHVDAMSRVNDLIGTVNFTSMLCYSVQAYMHLLLGNSYMKSGNYESAVQSFEHARAQLPFNPSPSLFVISLMFGWKFDDLDITLQQRLCEALYSAGRTKDASKYLLELVCTHNERVYTHSAIVKWVSDFTRQCLSTHDSATTPIPSSSTNAPILDTTSLLLLGEWAEATLAGCSWKDSLVTAVSFVVPRFATYRALHERLEAIDRVADATECLLEMASQLAREGNSEQASWITDFRHWCSGKLENIGDIAMDAQQYCKAIVPYSAALSLNPSNANVLFVKRSKAHANMGSWKDTLNDANEVIMLDPSSPLGYDRKHAALRGLGRLSDAEVAFQTMLLKMSESADPEIRACSRQYVQPAKTEEVIRGAIEDAIRESPSILINTDSGRLLDKRGQAFSFESQPIFHELVCSMTTFIDHIRIEDEVGRYYRYGMFSHKWEENEPLFKEVICKAVHELENSPSHEKLKMFCKMVRDAGLSWAWSDTCCINQEDPTALQEALVAMFEWYQGSALTVVYLLDAPSRRLVDSIWNSRAWTFQEYHASKVVRFYNKDWTSYRNLSVLNHKESPEIIAEMEEATGVSAQTLIALRPGFDDVREKLRLASTRRAMRVEDTAYALFGILSTSLSIKYGEGDQALGRLLAELLTSSGDTSILAWTGRSGSFNSGLPSKISVFKDMPTSHIPASTTSSEMEIMIAGMYNASLNLALVIRLHDQLNDLPVPSFVGRRMKLPCIVFKLGPLLPSWRGSEQVFRAQTAVLGIVEIKTQEDLTEYRSLYLVHPWIDFLLDRQPARSIQTIPEENTDDQPSLIGSPPSFSGPSNVTTGVMRPRTGLASRFGLSFGRRTPRRLRDAVFVELPWDTPPARSPSPVESLRPPSTLAEVGKQKQALRAMARLRRPFGALLLTPDLGNVAAYRRVAAESLITVQVEEITSGTLDKLMGSVRILDVL